MNQSQGSIAALESTINALFQYLDANQATLQPLAEVEQELHGLVQAIARAALARYVASCGTGDAGAVITDADGCKRRRHGIRRRTYRSLFGAIEIARTYYHDPLHGGVAPLDAALWLPERSYSYPLQALVARLAVTGAYDEGRDTLETLVGRRVPKAMAEEIVAEQAVHVRAFQATLPAPEKEGTVLVIQVDGKGVRMVVPKAPKMKGPRIRAKAARRQGTKKMAVVFTLYTLNPEAGCPPVPLNRKVYAHVGTKKEAFAWLQAEATKRGYGTKTTLFLSDGDPDLADLQRALLPKVEPCLDWIHATEYLWDAAHLFHAEGSQAARDWVKQRENLLMAGKVKGFVRGLKQVLTKRKKSMKRARREELAAIIGYFERNEKRMPYQAFFEAGYPFASGSVEGACRHLVADRMEGTGMRWKIPGAQAVLHVRSVHLNDEMVDFQKFYARREQERLYGVKPRSQATA